MTALLLVALFAVTLLLVLLSRVTERVLSVVISALALGLVLLLVALNVQVSGAGQASATFGRVQGALVVVGTLLGGSLLSLLLRPALGRPEDKFAKFRRRRATKPVRIQRTASPLLKLPTLRTKSTRTTGATRATGTGGTGGTGAGGGLLSTVGGKRVNRRTRTTGAELVFQDYEVLERVGIGGMGSVYRAKRRHDGRIVALKVPQEKYLADAKFVKRFYREAEVLKRFAHPNIVRVFDYRMQAPEHYIAMEFLEGESLEDLLENRRSLSFAESVQMLRALADALRHIHMQNVVHRDIKPANVMVLKNAFQNGQLREGGVKLMDFGIAVGKVLTRLTMTGARVGTPIYMAPEQAKGNRVDARSDVYSLGLLAYELVSGVTAFKGSYEAVVHQQVFEQPKPPKQVNIEVPGKLSDLILNMVEKDPAMRPTLDDVIARIDAGVLEDEVFDDPVALAVGIQEKTGTLRLLDLGGKLRVGLRDQGEGGLPTAPTAITTDEDGFLYVTLPDYRQGRAESLIRKLSAEGDEVLAFGPYGLEPGQLLRPVGIGYWDEHLYVLDAETLFISVFTVGGEYVRRFGGRGKGMGTFEKPTTLLVGPQGQLYVLDFGNSEVQRLSPEGEYLSRYAFRLDRNSDALRPLDGVGLDSHGGLYIVDSVGRKVRKVEADGTPGPTFALDTLVGEPVEAPWLLQIADNGQIYAMRQGGQVLRTFSPSGDLITQRDLYAPVQSMTLIRRPRVGARRGNA